MLVSKRFWFSIIVVALLLLGVVFFRMSSPVGYVIFNIGEDFSVGDKLNSVFVLEVGEDINSEDGFLVSLNRGSEEVFSRLYYANEVMKCASIEKEIYEVGKYSIDLECLMDYSFKKIGKYDLIFISLSENRRQIVSYSVE